MKTQRRDTHRTQRVASRALQELAAMLQREFADQRLKGVVLSHVEVTDDLSLARAFFVVIGDDADQQRAQTALKVLRALTPTIRSRLAARLAARRAMDVRFELDLGRDEALRIESLLREVSDEMKKPDGDA
jgi:ribosome-binding factor A